MALINFLEASVSLTKTFRMTKGGKWYATRESGCLPNQVVRARGASKLLRAIALESTK